MVGGLECGASRKCCGTGVSRSKHTQNVNHKDVLQYSMSKIMGTAIISSTGHAVRVENWRLTCEKSKLRKEMLVNLSCGTPERAGETDQMK